MIKEKIVKKIINERTIEDVICNKCSRSLKGEYGYNGINECLKELFDSFEIVVEKIEYYN